MNELDRRKLEMKEHAIVFLTYMRDRYRQRGRHDVAECLTVRIRDLDLEIRAIRAGRP